MNIIINCYDTDAQVNRNSNNAPVNENYRMNQSNNVQVRNERPQENENQDNGLSLGHIVEGALEGLGMGKIFQGIKNLFSKNDKTEEANENEEPEEMNETTEMEDAGDSLSDVGSESGDSLLDMGGDLGEGGEALGEVAELLPEALCLA